MTRTTVSLGCFSWLEWWLPGWTGAKKRSLKCLWSLTSSSQVPLPNTLGVPPLPTWQPAPGFTLEAGPVSSLAVVVVHSNPQAVILWHLPSLERKKDVDLQAPHMSWCPFWQDHRPPWLWFLWSCPGSCQPVPTSLYHPSPPRTGCLPESVARAVPRHTFPHQDPCSLLWEARSHSHLSHKS